MDLQTVRTGIATRLATISDLTTYWYHADRPSAPFVIICPESADLGPHMHSTSPVNLMLKLTICVMAAEGAEDAGQALLDAYLSTEGTSSISLALLGDADAGGSNTDLNPVSWQNYGRVVLEDGTAWFGAEMTVEVLA